MVQAAEKAYIVLHGNDKKYEPLIRPLFIEAVEKLANKNIKEQFKNKSTLDFWNFFKNILWFSVRILNYPKLHNNKEYSFCFIGKDEEVETVEQLRNAVQNFLKDMGDEKAVEDDYIDSRYIEAKIQTQPDNFYVNSPYFDKMVEAARDAYEVFSKDAK